MARTTTTNERTGEKVPRKSRGKNGKGRKYFGHRYGEGEGWMPVRPEAKKGVDFVMYGYPSEVRHKSVIEQHIQDEITKEELEEL